MIAELRNDNVMLTQNMREVHSLCDETSKLAGELDRRIREANLASLRVRPRYLRPGAKCCRKPFSQMYSDCNSSMDTRSLQVKRKPLSSKRNKRGTKMSGRSNRSVVERRVKNPERSRSENARAQAAEWELANALLDEALRHTFPASDAISIIQTVRGG
jgi:hypothetical protein